MAKKKEEKIIYSEFLEQFLGYVKEVESTYKISESEVQTMDDLRQDLFHKVELQVLSSNEKCKTITQMKKCAITRRENKDRCEELQPLHDWFKEEKNKRCINSLKEVLGQMRAAERRHNNPRHYNNRVLKE